MRTQADEILDGVEERFVAVDVKTVDAKKRMNLGEKVLKRMGPQSSIDAYKIFVGEDGDILLRPVVTVPSREAWIYKNKEVVESIRQGLAEAGEGKLKRVKNLKEYLKAL